MDTRFVLPVSVAVAVHALALFGFPKATVSSRPVDRPVDQPNTPVPVDIVVPEEPIPSDEKAESSATKGTPDELPRSPEPVETPRPNDFPQPQQPSSPVIHSAATKIPIGPVGVPEGIAGAPGGPGIFSSTMLDQTPRTRVQVAPVYPAEAKSSGRTAEVLVEFIVNEQGQVTNAGVVSSSDSAFDEATLQAVRKWRFEPGRKDGRVVSFRLRVPVMFNLND